MPKILNMMALLVQVRFRKWLKTKSKTKKIRKQRKLWNPHQQPNHKTESDKIPI